MSNFTVSETFASQFDVTLLHNFRLRFLPDGGQSNTLTDMDVNLDNIRLNVING